MVTFVYRKVTKDGEAVLFSRLQIDVERCFPNHQQFISTVLGEYGMSDWKVAFQPRHAKWEGVIVIPLKLICIMFHRRKEMIITLYHEILHYLHGDWGREKEKRINRMAVHWYVTKEAP